MFCFIFWLFQVGGKIQSLLFHFGQKQKSLFINIFPVIFSSFLKYNWLSFI